MHLLFCLFIIIFKEEPTALGNDGVYLGKRHFSCERRCGIFVPYDTLQPDTRFSSETQENEQSCVTKQEDVEVAEMLEAVPTIEGRTGYLYAAISFF